MRFLHFVDDHRVSIQNLERSGSRVVTALPANVTHKLMFSNLPIRTSEARLRGRLKVFSYEATWLGYGWKLGYRRFAAVWFSGVRRKSFKSVQHSSWMDMGQSCWECDILKLTAELLSFRIETAEFSLVIASQETVARISNNVWKAYGEGKFDQAV